MWSPPRRRVRTLVWESISTIAGLLLSLAGTDAEAALVKDTKPLKVTCQAKVQPIPYSLDEPSQGTVGVVFTSGQTIYCTNFGGTIKRDVQQSQFSAKDAPAPPSCPTPPIACP
jgi:hypothetical protein